MTRAQLQQNGILFMILYGALASSMGVFTKFLAPDLNVPTIVFWRFMTALLFFMPVFWWRKQELRPVQGRLILLRCFAGFISAYFQYYCFVHMPLAEAMALLYMAPVFVSLFSYIFIGEKVPWIVGALACISFGGCLMIVQPGNINGTNWIPAAAAIISSFGSATAYMVIRRLHQTERNETIVFFYLLFSLTAISLIHMHEIHWPQGRQWLWVILLGSFGYVSQISMTYSYKYTPAAVVSPFSYSSVFFSAFIAGFLWHDWPNLMASVGIMIITICGIALAKKSPRPNP